MRAHRGRCESSNFFFLNFDMFGLSGWCRLNEEGDRKNMDYDVWGVWHEDEELKWVEYGAFHCTSKKTSFSP
jgi:hypothetical protein